MRTRPLLAVAAALVVAGCGDDGGGSEAEGGFDACSLLTIEEVAGLLGREVDEGVADDLGDGTRCTWSTLEDSAVVGEPITLTVELGERTAALEQQVDDALAEPSNRRLDLGDRSVQVCGLGADGAACDSYDEVAVLAGNAYLEADLGNFGYPQDFTEERAEQIPQEAAELALS